MATWLTCTSCKKAYKYLDDNNATALKKQLGDAPFVCLRCGDTLPPLSRPEATHPDTHEKVRETHNTASQRRTSSSPVLIPES